MARESALLACQYAYAGVVNNSTLGDDYYNKNFPIIEKQILKAGIRLGFVLDGIFINYQKGSDTNQMIIITVFLIVMISIISFSFFFCFMALIFISITFLFFLKGGKQYQQKLQQRQIGEEYEKFDDS